MHLVTHACQSRVTQPTWLPTLTNSGDNIQSIVEEQVQSSSVLDFTILHEQTIHILLMSENARLFIVR